MQTIAIKIEENQIELLYGGCIFFHLLIYPNKTEYRVFFSKQLVFFPLANNCKVLEHCLFRSLERRIQIAIALKRLYDSEEISAKLFENIQPELMYHYYLIRSNNDFIEAATNIMLDKYYENRKHIIEKYFNADESFLKDLIKYRALRVAIGTDVFTDALKQRLSDWRTIYSYHDSSYETLNVTLNKLGHGVDFKRLYLLRHCKLKAPLKSALQVNLVLYAIDGSQSAYVETVVNAIAVARPEVTQNLVDLYQQCVTISYDQGRLKSFIEFLLNPKIIGKHSLKELYRYADKLQRKESYKSFSKWYDMSFYFPLPKFELHLNGKLTYLNTFAKLYWQGYDMNQSYFDKYKLAQTGERVYFYFEYQYVGAILEYDQSGNLLQAMGSCQKENEAVQYVQQVYNDLLWPLIP